MPGERTGFYEPRTVNQMTLRRQFSTVIALFCFVTLASVVAPAQTTGGQTKASSSDHDFVMKAAHGGMMEVEMARVALEKASSADVKQYAQRMIDDHTKANDELMRLASSKGITMPSDADHMKMMDKSKSDMSNMSGADFDKKYMAMQEKEHMKMLKLLEDEASKGGDADLKTFASNTIPTVREHLKMAQDWNKTKM